MKLFILLFIINLSYSQKTILLTNHYCGEGIVFNDNVKYPFQEKDYAEFYYPNIDDIKNAENILFKNYYNHKIEILNYFKLKDEKINPKNKNPNNVKKKFLKYNRQYIGYLNNRNEIIVYIGLLNFSNKKKAIKYFENWKENIIAGSGGFYNKNQEYFVINLTKKSIVKKVANL